MLFQTGDVHTNEMKWSYFYVSMLFFFNVMRNSSNVIVPGFLLSII